MAISTEQRAAIDALIGKGDVAGAQAALAKAKADADAAAKAAAPPREPVHIVRDLLASVAEHFGNHPKFDALLEELDAALAPKETPAAGN